MAIELDDLHYDWREVDGYNKPFNFVMSPREPGKTSMMWLRKIYFGWKIDKRPWIYLVRQSVEICEALIDSIADSILNKFTDDNVKFKYKTGSFKDGITDVFIVKDEQEELFFRIVSLSIQLRRIKLAVLKNIKGVFCDEYIINPKSGEKYQPQEAHKIKEAYTTWRRENPKLKMYFAGNPYSLFNPLFVDWNVNTNLLKVGQFYVGDIFVIQCADLKPALKAKLLEENPLYQFDAIYANYALYGKPVNDSHIRVKQHLPRGYFLKFIFRIQEKTIGVFQNSVFDEHNRFYVKEIENFSQNRTIFCFEFSELVERAVVLSMEERMKLYKFKEAFRTRAIDFENVSCYYLLEEVYKQL